MDSNPTGSYVLGISQAKILEWVAIFFSRGIFDPGIKPAPIVLLLSCLNLLLGMG